MDSPYKRLRVMTRTSQIDFAKKYNLSKTTMTYIESGQYPDLSDYMIEVLENECQEKHVHAVEVLRVDYHADNLSDAYHKWQVSERMSAYNLFSTVKPDMWTNGFSPMHFFIKNSTGSVQKFCKTLKVPSATVMRYVTGETRTMPKVLRQALTDAGYPHLHLLIDRQQSWLENR